MKIQTLSLNIMNDVLSVFNHINYANIYASMTVFVIVRHSNG